MPSDVEICNLALTRVAYTQPIASFGERSQAAELCRTLYAQQRDLVLQDFPWPFAGSIVSLADIGDPGPGWVYRYRYPADCLKLRGIVEPGRRSANSAESQIPFEVGFDIGGRVINTDQPQALARVTFRVEDPTFFDPMFVDALAWKIGSELAVPLTSKIEYRQSCEQQYGLSITKAQGSAFQESQGDPEPESEFVTVRS